MTTQHTPAPWKIGIRQPSSDKFIYGPSGEEIADCDRLFNTPQENLGNSRLISAAPELLDACEALMKAEAMQQGERNGYIMGTISQAIDKARDAIVKATAADR
jgi:hypothetical protein